jgi:UDP-3-O-[3-hydroxymyristoyl] glucosamine N-acyltransferase
MGATSSELSQRFYRMLRGEPEHKSIITATLVTTGSQGLAFCTAEKYRPQHAALRARTVELAKVDIDLNSEVFACDFIADSRRVSKRCMFAKQVGVAEHIKIADYDYIAASIVDSCVIRIAGASSPGPAHETYSSWHKNVVCENGLATTHCVGR